MTLARSHTFKFVNGTLRQSVWKYRWCRGCVALGGPGAVLDVDNWFVGDVSQDDRGDPIDDVPRYHRS